MGEKILHEAPDCDGVSSFGAVVHCEGCVWHNKHQPRPVSDPSETLALIAEHRLTVTPEGEGWFVSTAPGRALGGRFALTIGDAVRACVQRIKSAGDGRGTE